MWMKRFFSTLCVLLVLIAASTALAQDAPAAAQATESGPGLEALAFLVGGGAVLVAAIVLMAEARSETKK